MTASFLTLLLLALSIAVHTGLAAPSPIKHVVVLMLENRSFDHMLGFLKRNNSNINGLDGTEYQLLNTSDPSQGRLYVNDHALDVGVDDPCHSHSCTDEGIYGKPGTTNMTGTPVMTGFVQNAIRIHHNASNIISMWPPQRVPIITTLATEFALFDDFYCSHPGPTYPNRQFVHSGTAHGELDDEVPHGGFPQETIFRRMNNTAGYGPDSWKMYYEGKGGLAWAIFLQDVRNSPGNLFEMDAFYADALAGTLPTYSFIEPRISVNTSASNEKSFGLPNHQHPDASVSEGERLMKNMYEALRNGPAWDETLFIICYDEHGGFYDHQPPPQTGVPNPDGIKSKGGFDYNRLGVRIPVIAISPWIEKGVLVNEPPADVKPTPTSEWDLTSVLKTTFDILGLGSPLTARDAWAPSFEYLLNRTSPRTDCPATLPDVPPPSLDTEYPRLAALPLGDHHLGVISMLCDMLGEKEGECGKGVTTQGEFTQWQAAKWAKWQALTNSHA